MFFREEAVKQPEVHLGAAEGENFHLGDLLYSLMLESHNDTAVAVAEAISGSTAAFARGDESRKAKEIGCRETHFVSPNGLDWEDAEGAARDDMLPIWHGFSATVFRNPRNGKSS